MTLGLGGAKGDKGDKGERGSKGDQGVAGPKGDSAVSTGSGFTSEGGVQGQKVKVHSVSVSVRC